MRIIGIDSGKNGAAVGLDTVSGHGTTYRLKYDKTGILMGRDLFDWLKAQDPQTVLVEAVRGRGGPDSPWGATHNFRFGWFYGQLIQVLDLCLFPYRRVEPKVWQRMIHEGIGGKLKPKDRSIIAYRQLFPHDPLPRHPKAKGPHDGTLDALLIAHYGVVRLAGNEVKKWTFPGGKS